VLRCLCRRIRHGQFRRLLIAEKLSLGTVIIRVITQKPAADLIDRLRQRQYGVTVMDGQGANGPVQVVFTVVRRREVDDVIELVTRFNPRAFYSIEDVDMVERVCFPSRTDGIIPHCRRF